MEQMKKMPLEGIRVVELATVVAAPTASRVLCAFGAEVIKVETKIGDEMRRAGEFEMVVCEDDKNLFTIQNSGKRLTSIDRRTARPPSSKPRSATRCSRWSSIKTRCSTRTAASA